MYVLLDQGSACRSQVASIFSGLAFRFLPGLNPCNLGTISWPTPINRENPWSRINSSPRKVPYEEHEADDEQDVGLMRRLGLWEKVEIDRSPALLIFILRPGSPLLKYAL